MRVRSHLTRRGLPYCAAVLSVLLLACQPTPPPPTFVPKSDSQPAKPSPAAVVQVASPGASPVAGPTVGAVSAAAPYAAVSPCSGETLEISNSDPWRTIRVSGTPPIKLGIQLSYDNGRSWSDLAGAPFDPGEYPVNMLNVSNLSRAVSWRVYDFARGDSSSTTVCSFTITVR